MVSEIRSGIGDKVGDRVGDGIGDGIGDGLSSGIGGGKLDIYCCQHVRPSLRLIETPPASLRITPPSRCHKDVFQRKH